jgi:tRNA(Phe) wybutosine-synthesizing methylase Tyw3
MRNKILHIRITEAEKQQLNRLAQQAGFKSVSNYIRSLAGLSVKTPKMIPNPENRKPY